MSSKLPPFFYYFIFRRNWVGFLAVWSQQERIGVYTCCKTIGCDLRVTSRGCRNMTASLNGRQAGGRQIWTLKQQLIYLIINLLITKIFYFLFFFLWAMQVFASVSSFWSLIVDHHTHRKRNVSHVLRVNHLQNSFRPLFTLQNKYYFSFGKEKNMEKIISATASCG